MADMTRVRGNLGVMSHISLTYHIVFSTKERAPLLTSEWRYRVHDYLGGCLREAGAVPLRIGGTADHVHLLAGLRATHCVADVTRDVKRASSAWLHEQTRNRLFAWQEGYGAFTVSARDVAMLTAYVRGQEEHHRRRSFCDEYLALLEESGIEFDERYLW